MPRENLRFNDYYIMSPLILQEKSHTRSAIQLTEGVSYFDVFGRRYLGARFSSSAGACPPRVLKNHFFRSAGACPPRSPSSRCVSGPTDLKRTRDVFSVARAMARDRPSPYGEGEGFSPPYCIETGSTLLRGFMKHSQLTAREKCVNACLNILNRMPVLLQIGVVDALFCLGEFG